MANIVDYLVDNMIRKRFKTESPKISEDDSVLEKARAKESLHIEELIKDNVAKLIDEKIGYPEYMVFLFVCFSSWLIILYEHIGYQYHQYQYQWILICSIILLFGFFLIIIEIAANKTFKKLLTDLFIVREDLKKMEARYAAIFENMGSGVSFFQPIEDGADFLFVDINTSGRKIYKISKKEQVIGKKLGELFPFVKDFGLIDAIQRINTTGGSMIHPDIQYENDELIGWRKHLLLKLATGEMLSIFSDDTRQRLTELALLDFESRYRTLFNNASDAILVYNSSGRIIDVNQVACEMLGYTREMFLKMVMTDILCTKTDTPDSYQYMENPGSDRLVYEIEYQRVNGEIIPIEVSSRIVEYDQKTVVMTLARDISERKRAETEKTELLNQLRHAQKLEALGTMAGGIAHDFNNILQVVYGYTEMALLESNDNPGLKKKLVGLMAASRRAGELVHQILTFSRQKNEEYRPLEIHTIVKETIKMLRATLPSTIQINHRIEKRCHPVMANPTQIHQVVMNLCTNAHYAMRENGGVLNVKLNEVEIRSSDMILPTDFAPGKYLRLEVTDTGRGMNPEIIERIFEPYFSTKEKSEGTGLGLSVVNGIINKMNGHINVTSEPGQGTAFHIYLPVVDEKIQKNDADDNVVPIVGGHEHILLVDDEVEIVEMEQMFLKSIGYQVTKRVCSTEAHELFYNCPEQFDIVITDMTMPNMTGAELAKKILNIRPDIPIILCTGFSEAITEEQAKAIGIVEFIMKPVLRHDLAAIIRKVLDKNKGTR